MSQRKRKRRLAVILLPVVGVVTGCQSDVKVLQTWMTGSFSSADQHLSAPDDYHDIRLQMIPIWRHRTDGPWLYVEQATAQHLERPYRQRVYELRYHEDGTLESVVYKLPGDPLRFAGAWREPTRFDELSPVDLVLREGCSITLRRQKDGTFVGNTRARECESTLRGASYATSEVVIGPDRVESWDRGFDASDKQVWGTTQGGYDFARVASPPPADPP